MNPNGFNSFCDFYTKLQVYLNHERFASDLKLYHFLWSETPSEFVLSIKSIDSSFVPYFKRLFFIIRNKVLISI